jgi:sugar phosphate isomerase/epimerase
VLELDVFWAATAHQDVPALLGRLGPRVRALHVKDGVVGADPFLALSDFDPTHLDQRPAGQGDLAILDILSAARSAELAVIEFDHVAGDVFEAIGASVEFLHRAGVR